MHQNQRGTLTFATRILTCTNNNDHKPGSLCRTRTRGTGEMIATSAEVCFKGGQGVRKVPVREEEVDAGDVLDEIDDQRDVVGDEQVVHDVDQVGIVPKGVTLGAYRDSPFGSGNEFGVRLGEGGEPIESLRVSEEFVEDSL